MHTDGGPQASDLHGAGPNPRATNAEIAQVPKSLTRDRQVAPPGAHL